MPHYNEYKIISNDFILDGKISVKYSIKDYKDYGNAGVILLLENKILIIYGDDSGDLNKSEFELFLSSFKFTK